MRKGPVALLLLALTATAVEAKDKVGDAAVIGPLHAYLFYKNAGRLSDDLLARGRPFVGWNTVIGEGDAGEPADDVLIVATVMNLGAESFTDDALTVRVTDEGGDVIADRRFAGLLLPEKGTLHNPVWLVDTTCKGTITIRARFRRTERTETLQLQCGE